MRRSLQWCIYGQTNHRRPSNLHLRGWNHKRRHRERGGKLVLSGVALNGSLHTTGGTYSIQPTTTIAGDVEIENVRGAVDPGQICGAMLQRNLRFHHNTVGVQVGASDSCAGNTIDGNLHFHDNSGSTVIDFNAVTGNLDDNDNKGPSADLQEHDRQGLALPRRSFDRGRWKFCFAERRPVRGILGNSFGIYSSGIYSQTGT